MMIYLIEASNAFARPRWAPWSRPYAEAEYRRAEKWLDRARNMYPGRRFRLASYSRQKICETQLPDRRRVRKKKAGRG